MSEQNIDNSIKIDQIVSTIYGGQRGINYSNTIKFERDKLIEALNSFKGYGTDKNILKGDIAEYYHSGTFNINAAQRGSSHRTYVDRSHELGSQDVSSNFGKTWQSKYFKTGAESARQQSKSIFERYKEYQASGGKDTIDTFIRKKRLSTDQILNDPLYKGQYRLIPKDQMEEAIKWLERKIQEESVKRPDQVERYKETLKLLTDRLKDNQGNQSIPLSESDAKRLAALAKKGDITAEQLNLTNADIIKMKFVIQNAAKVGIEAAAISAGITLVLTVFQKWAFEDKSISDFTADDWQALFGTTFFNAGTAGISAATLSVVGSYCESAVPGAGALLMAVFGIASLIPDYIEGNINEDEFLVEAEMVCLDAALILAGTVLGQTVIPVPGLGALIGAIAASIAWYIIDYFWGDDLRELLNILNHKIQEMIEALKEFFINIWMTIVKFFDNLFDHIKMLLDKDFNTNIKFKYSKWKAQLDENPLEKQKTKVEAKYEIERTRTIT